MDVLWICGPPGVGKSTVAWSLFGGSSEATGYVDIDQLGMRFPAAAGDPGHARLKGSALAAVLHGHREAGARHVIVSGVALPADVAVVTAALPFPITWVRLQASPAQLHRRFLGRDGSLELLPAVEAHAADLDRSSFADLVVDTTGRDPAAVAGLIRSATHTRLTRTVEDDRTAPQASQEPLGRPGSQVLLLCGPRVVGTSTVGWGLVQQLSSRAPTALVDLAQVGFVGAASTEPRSRHRLRARNLAALSAVFGRGGAETVVAVGSVLLAAEVTLYRELLAPARLTVCRLRATDHELRDRIAIRATGRGGPHLAGDDLRHSSAEQQAAVLSQARAESAVLERSSVGDLVLDTSGREAADCVAELVTRLATA